MHRASFEFVPNVQGSNVWGVSFHHSRLIDAQLSRLKDRDVFWGLLILINDAYFVRLIWIELVVMSVQCTHRAVVTSDRPHWINPFESLCLSPGWASWKKYYAVYMSCEHCLHVELFGSIRLCLGHNESWVLMEVRYLWCRLMHDSGVVCATDLMLSPGSLGF